MSQAVPYSIPASKEEEIEGKVISHFPIGDRNIDTVTVESFGEEWEKFDDFDQQEIHQVGNEYFDIIDLEALREARALDVGCGTGRWTKFLAKHVAHIDAIDPSKAIYPAAKLLREEQNVRLSVAGVSDLPFANDSFDFVFSLGVLHHIPDTSQAMKDAVSKLRPGGQFLVYLYYSLDNKGAFYKFIFHCSTFFRRMICKMPQGLKSVVCDIIAFTIYLPFIGLGKLVKALTPNSKLYQKVPLSYYIGKSLNIVRNDALDRFGTPLEQRFSRKEIEQMMTEAGLEQIRFSENTPYWHAVGIKKSQNQ
ncbi:MAG: class I SAM-dependent methyltransferase [Bacteroidetes bacterium]|nr:MAG: class I SAM-dependent methyltransferase [Bacteroidota bacterium]